MLTPVPIPPTPQSIPLLSLSKFLLRPNLSREALRLHLPPLLPIRAALLSWPPPLSLFKFLPKPNLSREALRLHLPSLPPARAALLSWLLHQQPMAPTFPAPRSALHIHTRPPVPDGAPALPSEVAPVAAPALPSEVAPVVASALPRHPWPLWPGSFLLRTRLFWPNLGPSRRPLHPRLLHPLLPMAFSTPPRGPVRRLTLRPSPLPRSGAFSPPSTRKQSR